MKTKEKLKYAIQSHKDGSISITVFENGKGVTVKLCKLILKYLHEN